MILLGFTQNISTDSLELATTASPNKLIACGDETLTLSCPDTHVVTGDIMAGRNDYGTCEYQPDGCNGDPVEPSGATGKIHVSVEPVPL